MPVPPGFGNGFAPRAPNGPPPGAVPTPPPLPPPVAPPRGPGHDMYVPKAPLGPPPAMDNRFDFIAAPTSLKPKPPAHGPGPQPGGLESRPRFGSMMFNEDKAGLLGDLDDDELEFEDRESTSVSKLKKRTRAPSAPPGIIDEAKSPPIGPPPGFLSQLSNVRLNAAANRPILPSPIDLDNGHRDSLAMKVQDALKARRAALGSMFEDESDDE